MTNTTTTYVPYNASSTVAVNKIQSGSPNNRTAAAFLKSVMLIDLLSNSTAINIKLQRRPPPTERKNNYERKVEKSTSGNLQGEHKSNKSNKSKVVKHNKNWGNVTNIHDKAKGSANKTSVKQRSSCALFMGKILPCQNVTTRQLIVNKRVISHSRLIRGVIKSVLQQKSAYKVQI